MASKNISFTGIPSTIRKPGKHFEFNTKLAVRTLPANAQPMLIVGQRLTAGAVAALVPAAIFSDEEAAVAFGRGSLVHLMVRAAITANPYLQLTAIAVDDAAGAVAASGTITIAGPATAAGVVTVNIIRTRVDVAVAAADTADAVAAALQAAIAKQTDLPVTAAVAGAVVTLTARHKGASGNDIKVSASSTAAGVTAAVVAMANGATDPDIAPALAAMVAAGHKLVASPFSTQAALVALRAHLDFVSGPLEQRPARAAAGWSGSLATGTTLAGQVNSGREVLGWHRGSVSLPCEIAAAYAAVIASEEDPARPLNGLELLGLDVVPLDQRPSRTEQENALYNGLAPLEVGPGDRVQIVRAISTYTKDAQGADDKALLDITTIGTMDYTRQAVLTRLQLRFPREKKTERVKDKVRSEVLDVLYKLEELEVIENVAENAPGVLVEDDLQDESRLNIKIPVDVVNGLHVIAGVIDLML